VPHKDPVLLITNFITQGNAITVNNLDASFQNCIFWGEENGFVKDEVVAAKQGNTQFNLSFDRVLWRVQTAPKEATVMQNSIIPGEPRFDSINTARRFFNFRLKEDSPAVNAGRATGVTVDLDGKTRPVGAAPDLGAYEWRQ
jgi:hypothetical protein